jgi:hypothetical protein
VRFFPGAPGKDPVKIFRGSLRPDPISTHYGSLCIMKPYPHIWNVGLLPASGIGSTSKKIPGGLNPGAELYFQALHGPSGDPSSELADLL